MRKKTNSVFFKKLLCTIGVFLKAEIYNAAHANLFEKRQRLLGGIATSVHSMCNPAQRYSIMK
jgi:hypothetical protein